MSIAVHSGKNNGSGTILTSGILRSERRGSGMSIAAFARLLGLRNRSSLIRYETGKRPISHRLESRFVEWKSGKRQYYAEIISSIGIPAGTLLPNQAQVARCEECGRNFISMNKARRFHDRACQLKNWRRRKKEALQ